MLKVIGEARQYYQPLFWALDCGMASSYFGLQVSMYVGFDVFLLTFLESGCTDLLTKIMLEPAMQKIANDLVWGVENNNPNRHLWEFSGNLYPV